MLWKGSWRDRTASVGGQRGSILGEQADVQQSRSVRLPRSSTLCLTSHFAEEIQLLLHDAIGEAEDGAVLGRRERERRPARHHEDVLRRKREALPGDCHRSRPFDHREDGARGGAIGRSEEHTSELQSLMSNSYAVFCLTKKKTPHQ